MPNQTLKRLVAFVCPRPMSAVESVAVTFTVVCVSVAQIWLVEDANAKAALGLYSTLVIIWQALAVIKAVQQTHQKRMRAIFLIGDAEAHRYAYDLAVQLGNEEMATVAMAKRREAIEKLEAMRNA